MEVGEAREVLEDAVVQVRAALEVEVGEGGDVAEGREAFPRDLKVAGEAQLREGRE